MKCYKQIVLIFLFAIDGLSAQTLGKLKVESPLVIEQINSVQPIESNLIKNGEIYKVQIKTKKTDTELSSYQNKMINKVMYVLELIVEGDDRYFKVFVTDPPKDKKDEKETVFDMSGFDYKPEAKQTEKDFYQIESTYKLEKNMNYLIKVIMALLLIMFLSALSWFGYGLYKKRSRKNKKRKKQIKRAKELIDVLDNAKTRSDFEVIYLNRIEIKELVEFDDSSFSKLIEEINNFQYKQNWSEVEMNKIKNKMGLIKNYKVGRGV